MRRALSFASGAVILCLLIVGCTQTPAPTATPTPVPVAAPSSTGAPSHEEKLERIVLGGSELLLIGANGSTLERIPYSFPPEQAIESLTNALGVAPVREVIEMEHCKPQEFTAVWGGGALTVIHGPELWGLAPEARFKVQSTARAVGSVEVSTANGSSVGESIDELVRLLPDLAESHVQDDGTLFQWVPFDVTLMPVDPVPEDATEPYWGGGAHADDGEITMLFAGVELWNNC